MRAALSICLLLLVAAPAALASRDRDRGHDVGMTDVLRALELRLESGAIFRPRTLMVLDGAQALSVVIPNPAPVRDEDRVDLRGVPLIGGVFQPTASGDFRGAPRVGVAWRLDDALVIGTGDSGTAAGLIDGVRLVVIANRNISHQLPVDFATRGAARPGAVPPIGDLFRIGDVHRSGNALLVLVRPTVVDIGD